MIDMKMNKIRLSTSIVSLRLDRPVLRVGWRMILVMNCLLEVWSTGDCINRTQGNWLLSGTNELLATLHEACQSFSQQKFNQISVPSDSNVLMIDFLPQRRQQPRVF
jgi:hypothetical protein